MEERPPDYDGSYEYIKQTIRQLKRGDTQVWKLGEVANNSQPQNVRGRVQRFPA